MAKYEYKSNEAEELFSLFLRNLLEDEITQIEELEILTKIHTLEPDIADPPYFYYLGKAVQKAGDEQESYSLFRKAFELDEKYKTFETNIVLGHLVNREIGLFHFKKGQNAEREAQKNQEFSLTKKHLQIALEYWFNAEEEQHQILKEVIRRCDVTQQQADPRSASAIRQTESDSQTSRDTGCFIASAAYDSSLAEPVQRLRHVRDDVLRKTAVGAEFFDKYWQIYYRLSPIIVGMMNEDKEVRDLVRWSFVEPLVAYLTFSEKILRSPDTLSKEHATFLLEEFKQSLFDWLESMAFRTSELREGSVADSIRNILEPPTGERF